MREANLLFCRFRLAFLTILSPRCVDRHALDLVAPLNIIAPPPSRYVWHIFCLFWMLIVGSDSSSYISSLNAVEIALATTELRELA